MWEKVTQNKDLLKTVGLVVVTILLLVSWLSGWFAGIFYLFGFYAAIYVVSKLFKTSALLEFIIGAGSFLLYIGMGIWLLWILYIALQIMFEESFILGLLIIFIGLPIAQMLLYFLFFAIGAVLGAPLFWMLSDLERDLEQPQGQKIVEGELISPDPDAHNYFDRYE